ILIVIIVVFVVLIPPLIDQSISGINSLWNTMVNLVTQPIYVTEDQPLILSPVSLDPDADRTPIAIWDYINLQLQAQGFTDVTEWLLATSQSFRLDRATIQQFFSIGGGVT